MKQCLVLWLPAVSSFVLFCGGTVQAAEAEIPARPNIVLLLADNWAWPYAGACGDKLAKTPTFDRLARDGVLFTHAFCQNPSCAPARAVLLTGQASHRLGEAANLCGNFPASLTTYPTLLQKSGYANGYTIKGWGPGHFRGMNSTKVNPVGKKFANFTAFLKTVPKNKPFCFWFGSHDPHLPWNRGSKFQSNFDPADVEVPPYLPDHAVVRKDITNYYAEIQQLDRECGQVIETLKNRELLENTLIIMVGDNGWQMPRGLANVYDGGTRVPMAVHWPARIKPGQVSEEFLSFEDFAPTFLDAAGLAVPQEMTGQSFLPLTKAGEKPTWRKAIFLERERHANVRAGDLTYPCRAIRTKDYLYVRNLFPDRWPAGDPKTHWAVGSFGDVNNMPTKELILANRDKPEMKPCFELGFGKRPAEELYDLAKDPHQINNVAAAKEYEDIVRKLSAQVNKWMIDTGDPRTKPENHNYFDRFPYYGGPAKK